MLVVGCGPSAPDISIHDAAKSGFIEPVKQHIAAWTDVNAKDEEGWTPLHKAANARHKEIAELLIAKGADLNAKIEAGQYTGTPLDWAEGVPWRDSPEVKASKKETADLLRKHGGKTGEELKAAGNQTNPLHHLNEKMKHLLLTTIAAVVLVGCGTSIYKAAKEGKSRKLNSSGLVWVTRSG